MNAAQIHLALNHAPLFLSVIGGGILLAGLFRKNDSYISLALYFLIAAALFTFLFSRPEKEQKNWLKKQWA